MARKAKSTTGLNDRPVDESIAQSGEGLPDDSGKAIEADEAQIARARASLEGQRSGSSERNRNPDPGQVNPEAVTKQTPGSGENICRRCAGTGQLGDGPCPDCNGSGKVITPLGGG